jgi:hypothetical protein
VKLVLEQSKFTINYLEAGSYTPVICGEYAGAYLGRDHRHLPGRVELTLEPEPFPGSLKGFLREDGSACVYDPDNPARSYDGAIHTHFHELVVGLDSGGLFHFRIDEVGHG